MIGLRTLVKFSLFIETVHVLYLFWKERVSEIYHRSNNLVECPNLEISVSNCPRCLFCCFFVHFILKSLNKNVKTTTFVQELIQVIRVNTLELQAKINKFPTMAFTVKQNTFIVMAYYRN